MSPTVTGLFAVVIWGMIIPFARICEERFGFSGTVGIVFLGSAILGLVNYWWRGTFPPDKRVFRNPFLYGRWLFFVLHETLIMIAILIVQRVNLPFVILLNYLWPTAIIIFSLLVANVGVTRWWAFTAGSGIVLTSLSIEILGPRGVSVDLFASPTDRLAYAMAFAGALSWALYSALYKRAGALTGEGAVIPLSTHVGTQPAAVVFPANFVLA